MTGEIIFKEMNTEKKKKQGDREKRTEESESWTGRKMCISKYWINREQKPFHFSDCITHYDRSPNTKTHNLLQH